MWRKRWLGKVLPFVLLGSLLEHWETVRLIFTFTPWHDSHIGFALSLVWLVLLLASMIGIGARRRWGAVSLIALVPLSTVGLSLSLIPLVTSVLPADARPHGMMLLNLLVLVAAITLATPSVREPAAQSA